MTVMNTNANRRPRIDRCLVAVLAFVLGTATFCPVFGQEKQNPFDEDKPPGTQEETQPDPEKAPDDGDEPQPDPEKTPAAEEEKEPADQPAEQPKEEKPPLLERDPFDLLTTYDDDGKDVPLEILPVTPPGEELPPNPDPNSKLRVRLVIQPELEYEIFWRDIRKLQRYQEMVLAEGRALVAENKFDEAYDRFAYLLKNYPKTSGLSKAIEDYLFLNASAAFREGRFDEALAMLFEIDELELEREGLVNAVSLVTDRVIDLHVRAEDYRIARAIIRGVEQRYEEGVPPSVESWRKRMIEAAGKQRDLARQHLQAKRLDEAHAASRKMLAIWPKLEGAEAILRDVNEAYPLVSVAVTHPAAACPPERRLASPAARRIGRLLDRKFVERSVTPTGETDYFFPFGRIVPTADRTSLNISVAPTSDANLPLNAFDLSQRLLGFASPGHEDYRPLLGQTISQVAVTDAGSLDVTFRQPPVRPEALFLGLPVVSEGAESSWVRPYRPGRTNGSETRFVLNDDYVLAGPRQPTVIAEHHFDDPLLAMQALDAGEVDVLARVYPWQVRRLSEDDRFVVGRYALPSVHVLELRTDKPPFTSRTFRRALIYAINRHGILSRQFLNEQTIEGCEVVSGPFPTGINEDDPLGYASDRQKEPRQHKPMLAWALLKAAEAEFLLNFPDPKKNPVKRKLVLAYPADELARGACESIQRYLTMVGLTVELKELPPGQIHDPTGEYDLLYSEWTLTEPAVDVWQLLQPGGLLAHASSHLGLPLRRLGRASTFPEAREELRHMHRIAYDDIPVVPLWQIMNFYAVRKNVEGLQAIPDLLYANVEDWKLTPWLPEE